nr:hypothetical protein [Tanacetum cinerariifolium]
MTTLAEFMILSGAHNHPPILDKDLYDPWKSLRELYIQNREHERMILELVQHGLLTWPTIEENGVIMTKKYAELSPTEKIQVDCDLKETNIICQDLGIAEGSITQTVITNDAAYQADDFNAYDSDCDDITMAKVALMANLSRSGSDVLSEIRPMLYDGNVIAKETNVISIANSEETLMLEEESRSKMLLKQSDPMVLQKKVNIQPVNYAVLNQLSEEFVDVPSELPKLSLVNASLKRLKFHIAPFDSVANKRITTDALIEGVKCSTSTYRSQPTGNKKNERISQLSSSNIKNKVEAQPRKVNKKNRVVEPICDANVKHTMLNVNSQLICVTCKKCMFDANHDVCFLDVVNEMNMRAKSKSKSAKKSTVDPTLVIRREGKDILLILQSPRGIFLNQSKYALESLKKYDMESCDLMDTLMMEKSKLDEDPQGKDVNPTHYRGMVGTLMCLTSSRPYLDSTIALIAFADADHASCQDTRRSTSGSMQLLGDRLVSWSSKRQKSAAISSTKAEYIALSGCCA